ncbi:MAG: NUDIX domain-containing protein [Chloroflexi bacterium]|nr:NUDIX domain-containing protein [Chloroflexota bacterium]
MTGLLVKTWRLMRGPLQWYALWLAHHKFIIGVSGVVLDDQQRVLLLRHRYWKPGSWGLPSGYAERNEKLEGTLCRELREETGYHMQVQSLLRIVSGYKLRLEVSYIGHIRGGELQLDSKEVIEARFFALHELPEGLLPSHRELIALAFSETP